jgi:hypothetical protein
MSNTWLIRKLLRNSGRARACTWVAVLGVISLPATGQWIKYPTAGIPRTPDGKPDLKAPAPRTSYGKADLSGIWKQPDGVKYTVNLAADLPPGSVPMRPAAAALYKYHRDTLSKDDPVGHCHMAGVPQEDAVPYPYKIFQTPTEIVILYEAVRGYRQIFLDGRDLPQDPNPTTRLGIGMAIRWWSRQRGLTIRAGSIRADTPTATR